MIIRNQSKNSVKQCKVKIRNLKDSFKRAKEQDNKSGEEPNFPPYYDIFDDVLGERDATVPNLTQVGVQEQMKELIEDETELKNENRNQKERIDIPVEEKHKPKKQKLEEKL